MLLSLISVLVLLVIAFYALWVGTMGRVSGNEGAELSLTGRVVVFGIALVAFGVAYAIYSQPQYETETVATVPATPSTPPESRGGIVAETGDEGETVKPAPANSSDSAMVSRADTPDTAVKALPTAAAAARPETEDDDQGLSAGAALLEAQASQPRRQPPAPFQATDDTTPIRVADASVEKPMRTDSSRTTQSAPRAATRTQRNPLLLHVHNRLGSDQLSEQLTLIIEGKPVADIAVDGSRPAVAVTVPLPRPGLLHYRLEGTSEQDGTTRLMGEGCIRVRDGARFAVRRKDGSHKVYLEATRAAG